MHGLMACNAKIYIITIHRRENLNDSITVYSNAFPLYFVSYLGGGGGDLHTCPKSLLHSPYLRTYNGHCYEFKLDGGLSWVEAESACRNHGGHLVSVNSPEERQFLLTTLFSMWFHGDYVLIGLTDSKREGTFVWSSGH